MKILLIILIQLIINYACGQSVKELLIYKRSPAIECRCPRGEYVTRACNITAGENAQCSGCPHGTFNKYHDQSEGCEDCSYPGNLPPNSKMISPCNATHDIISDCKDGYSNERNAEHGEWLCVKNEKENEDVTSNKGTTSKGSSNNENENVTSNKGTPSKGSSNKDPPIIFLILCCIIYACIL